MHRTIVQHSRRRRRGGEKLAERRFNVKRLEVYYILLPVNRGGIKIASKIHEVRSPGEYVSTARGPANPFRRYSLLGRKNTRLTDFSCFAFLLVEASIRSWHEIEDRRRRGRWRGEGQEEKTEEKKSSSLADAREIAGWAMPREGRVREGGGGSRTGGRHPYTLNRARSRHSLPLFFIYATLVAARIVSFGSVIPPRGAIYPPRRKIYLDAL